MMCNDWYDDKIYLLGSITTVLEEKQKLRKNLTNWVIQNTQNHPDCWAVQWGENPNLTEDDEEQSCHTL